MKRRIFCLFVCLLIWIIWSQSRSKSTSIDYDRDRDHHRFLITMSGNFEQKINSFMITFIRWIHFSSKSSPDKWSWSVVHQNNKKKHSVGSIKENKEKRTYKQKLQQPPGLAWSSMAGSSCGPSHIPPAPSCRGWSRTGRTKTRSQPYQQQAFEGRNLSS